MHRFKSCSQRVRGFKIVRAIDIIPNWKYLTALSSVTCFTKTIYHHHHHHHHHHQRKAHKTKNLPFSQLDEKHPDENSTKKGDSP